MQSIDHRALEVAEMFERLRPSDSVGGTNGGRMRRIPTGVERVEIVQADAGGRPAEQVRVPPLQEYPVSTP